MISKVEKSAGVTELLRSMFRAWYEYTKEETGGCVTSATVDIEQKLDTEDQQQALVASVLFQSWKMRALHPVVRERRKRRNSNVEWVQRMIAPITPRGGTNPHSEECRRPPWNKSGEGANGYATGSRYLRIQTIPPERIRYGRNIAVPLAPTATAKSLSSCSLRWDANISGSLGRNGLHKEVSPRTITTRQCRRLMQRGRRETYPQRRRGRDQNAIDEAVQKDADGLLVERSGLWNNADAGTEGWTPPENGFPLSWNEMEPWGKRKTSLEKQGYKDAAGMGGPLVAEAVLREVENYLEHYTHLEERQMKALGLCRKNHAERSFAAVPIPCSARDRNPTSGLSKGPCNPISQKKGGDIVGRTCPLAKTRSDSNNIVDKRQACASGKCPGLGLSEVNRCSPRMAMKNARVVMFGPGSRLGKASNLEDRWV